VATAFGGRRPREPWDCRPHPRQSPGRAIEEAHHSLSVSFALPGLPSVGACTQGSVAGPATGSRGRTHSLTLGCILAALPGLKSARPSRPYCATPSGSTRGADYRGLRWLARSIVCCAANRPRSLRSTPGYANGIPPGCNTGKLTTTVVCCATNGSCPLPKRRARRLHRGRLAHGAQRS